MTWVQINMFSGQTVNHSKSPAATAATPHGQLRAQTSQWNILEVKQMPLWLAAPTNEKEAQ